MNLLEIIQTYLNKTPAEGDTFLEHLVAEAGMPRYLVKHIKGCRAPVTVSAGPEVGWCETHEKEHFLNGDGSCWENPDSD